ncbi:MAG: sel1 repeat family protein, partial [Campylobacter sp.]|nr:sel1 repeat family protein [Campylobacter sp.]
MKYFAHIFIVISLIFSFCFCETYTKKDIIELEKKCKNRDFESCGVLGILYDKGHGVKQNYKKSSEFYSL